MADISTEIQRQRLRELGIIDDTDNTTSEFNEYLLTLTRSGKRRHQTLLYFEELLDKKLVLPGKDKIIPDDIIFFAFMIKDFDAHRSIMPSKPVSITDGKLLDLAEGLAKIISTSKRLTALWKQDAKKSYFKAETFSQ